MAVDDLTLLNRELPEVFAPVTLPEGWDEDLIFIPIEDADKIDDSLWDEMGEDFAAEARSGGLNVDSTAPAWPLSPLAGPHPGAPTQPIGQYLPPPDALAFYLPFHYFFPDWWGVYLLVEGVQLLADFIQKHSGGTLSPKKAWIVARAFLYGHEAYHHRTESFATRLEITHRKPLYKEGFDRLYREEMAKDASSEEALATAAGYAISRKLKLLNHQDVIKIQQALWAFIDGCPPSYRKALTLLKPQTFKGEECEFAERNQSTSLALPTKDPEVWRSFPHAFSGISRINSHINYVIHRHSSLATRGRLSEQYFRYKDVTAALKRLGCSFVRTGRGSHEIWTSPKGGNFPIPNHRRDLPLGTLRTILREAGLDMSVEQFRRV